MAGHSFQNYDVVYVGFSAGLLVDIPYVRAFIPYMQPFLSRIYAYLKTRIYA